MKKLLAALLVCLLLVSVICAANADEETDNIPQPTLAPDAPPYDANHPEDLDPDQLYAWSAVLMSADTGDIIFEKDANVRRFPASTTKILTTLLGIMMVDDLNQTVTVSETAVNVPEDSSLMGLSAGEEIRFIDVLYGTMLLSGNDGANVIAETVSGSIPAFVDLMNRTAEAFGCADTHFANAHGYHDENHYSTARDIAVIAREAMKNEMFRQIVGTTSYSIPKTNMHKARNITTKSEYMLPGTEEKPNKYYFPEGNGIKTGSHSHAGYCFVGSATRNDVDMISVVLYTGHNARWADTIKLLNYGFSQYTSITPDELYNKNPIVIQVSNFSTSDTNRGRIQLICTPQFGREDGDDGGGNTEIIATKEEISRMANRIKDTFLIQYTRDFIAPVTAGEIMGTMTYYPDVGDPIVYNLTAARSVDKRENAPKTLDEIVAETYADPNPFPPFSFEIALFIIGPVVLIAALIIVLHRVRKNRRSRHGRIPKPVSRHLK